MDTNSHFFKKVMEATPAKWWTDTDHRIAYLVLRERKLTLKEICEIFKSHGYNFKTTTVLQYFKHHPPTTEELKAARKLTKKTNPFPSSLNSTQQHQMGSENSGESETISGLNVKPEPIASGTSANIPHAPSMEEMKQSAIRKVEEGKAPSWNEIIALNDGQKPSFQIEEEERIQKINERIREKKRLVEDKKNLEKKL